MSHFKIKKPIWKTRSVGIAEHRITAHNTISIEYRNKDGLRLYPKIYYISKKDAFQYPVQVVRGIRLRIIPIDDLERNQVIKYEEMIR